MAWLNDLVTQLTAEGVGTYGSDIFISTRVTPPVLASGLPTIHLLATEGLDPELTHNDLITPAYLQPTAQVTVRAGNWDLADARARLASNALYKIRNQTISGTWYKWVKLQGDLLDMGMDDRGQIRVAFNVRGNKRP